MRQWDVKYHYNSRKRAAGYGDAALPAAARPVPPPTPKAASGRAQLQGGAQMLAARGAAAARRKAASQQLACASRAGLTARRALPAEPCHRHVPTLLPWSLAEVGAFAETLESC